MANEKIILAYSGGLDTSVAIPWLIEKGYDVVATCINVGEVGKDMDFIKEKALKIGAVASYTLDCREEFAQDYVTVALQGHTLYEGEYPLVSALSRPLIAKKLVEVAKKEGATAIAHGCTGKGNDQVRFEVAIRALAPEMKIEAPVRDWKWSREEEINYAKDHDIPVPIKLGSPYSIDQNLWGRANEAGVLEDPWVTPPADAYDLTNAIEDTPDEADKVEIEFKQGVPVALNGEKLGLVDLIAKLDKIAGKHGIGRIDHIENRLVGIKSREVYEAPAAEVLIKAHKALEDLTFERDLAHFKPTIELQLTNTIYNGLWFSPLFSSLLAFLKTSQQVVTGTIRVKLFKGNATVEGRKSPYSLYDKDLATYTSSDTFDHVSAVGFIKLWGLPTQVYTQVQDKVNGEQAKE
ncbi:argininosuccinate synthase [Loigolactobacillus coryniformis]|jgi:argininosuccinate synthase|uniref:Argininosuccinate synthase n=1 Tax=Loigolactobacillus coryniformis subsp. coryniformis KCTC 3167 = DSM 20001 TaxID=913848 RepID=A0A0R1FAQ1_9LACO|nr:argininosuccinate synthase [Loigolactobacillus coryniformis]MDT3392694.1 argininosuccinate synthase [Bacillota bacterium]OEH90805.1 argininosuccinate synthase [Loigolactobacillus coryniformis subsp. coryniformis]RRG06236.1 MAG: argininosuccinate synthase [Lactobacillus sp.]ATO56061.1 argininosuccinate synthase [Loigolactobacillus coryniformis subsp. coryniformis KCTC 3167 = DSM 20001]KRK18742.1 argininosuccinate synthase [Loigolactobacillus coryniformis subsp. coryniformis KCTC 3167 = DSM 2